MRPAGRGSARLRLPRFRRKRHGHHLLYHRHHGPAQGGLLQPPPDHAAHLRAHVRPVCLRVPGKPQFRGCLHAHDAHVSRPRLGNSLSVHHAGHQAGLPGQIRTGNAAQADRLPERHLLPLCAHDHPHAGFQPGHKKTGPVPLEGGHRRQRPVPRACARPAWKTASTSTPPTA
jgi:hypothetical protein